MWYVLGDGELRGLLEETVAKYGLEKLLILTGYVTNVEAFLIISSIYVLTSRIEGLPMCLMEGQQYGAIPVSFDSYSGIREITCDGECGIMVPAYSLRKYAELLHRALADE